MNEYNIHYAQGANAEDTGLPPQFVAGDTPALVTQDFQLIVAALIPQYTPLTRDATNGFVPWAAGDTLDAIAPFDLPAGTYRKVLITAVMANTDAIKWPAGTTEAEAEAAQTGMIRHRKLLYSDQRTGNESPEVGPGNEAGQAVWLAPSGGALTPGTESVAYSADIVASGLADPYTYAVTSGALPAGVTLNPATGALSGTVGADAAGTYEFEVTATHTATGNTRSGSYTIVVAAA